MLNSWRVAVRPYTQRFDGRRGEALNLYCIPTGGLCRKLPDSNLSQMDKQGKCSTQTWNVEHKGGYRRATPSFRRILRHSAMNRGGRGLVSNSIWTDRRQFVRRGQKDNRTNTRGVNPVFTRRQAALNPHRMTPFLLRPNRSERTTTKNNSCTGQINSFFVIVWR